VIKTVVDAAGLNIDQHGDLLHRKTRWKKVEIEIKT
jgi:hypothetical protein